jgi:SAM-dependent methyltransferase
MSHSVVDWTKRAQPSELQEWMDEPCSYEDFRTCLRDLARVNRWTFATKPTIDFLERMTAAKTNGSQPLRIVDVGSGGGDMLRAIEHWARKSHIPVRLVGIDLNPYAKRAAMEFTQQGSEIEWITGDAFSYDGAVDVVVSSLFTHHLSDEEIIQFLNWSDAIARRGWFVSDLCREPMPYRLFGAWSKLMRWHRFVQHDGPVSFRRSFREADWRRYTAAAGVAEESVLLKRWTPARLCVERMR